MKSIVEEASSIAKAVEKGWIRAGKPQEFSVKIFEEAEKNFFGLTTKPAKIAIVFAQAAKGVSERERQEKRPATREQRHTQQAEPTHSRHERHERPHDRDEQRHPRRDSRHEKRFDRRRPDDRSQREQREERRPQPQQSAPQQASQPAPHTRQPHAESAKTWNDEAVAFSSQWLSECLALLGLPNVSINTSTAGNTLNIQLSSPVADNSRNERFFLSSLSHLLAEAIRGKFKIDMRSLRIMIQSN